MYIQIIMYCIAELVDFNVDFSYLFAKNMYRIAIKKNMTNCAFKTCTNSSMRRL